MKEAKVFKRKMTALRILKVFAGLISLAGFICILGTAGSSDLDFISFSQIFCRSLAGLTMFVAGFFIIWFSEKYEKVLIYRHKVYVKRQALKKREKERQRRFDEFIRDTEEERRVEDLFEELEKL